MYNAKGVENGVLCYNRVGLVAFKFWIAKKKKKKKPILYSCE